MTTSAACPYMEMLLRRPDRAPRLRHHHSPAGRRRGRLALRAAAGLLATDAHPARKRRGLRLAVRRVRLGLRALARHGGRRAEPAAAAAGHSRHDDHGTRDEDLAGLQVDAHAAWWRAGPLRTGLGARLACTFHLSPPACLPANRGPDAVSPD